MENLRSIPGVQVVQPLHFFDLYHRPVQCDLVVHPAQGWTIATELPQAGCRGFHEGAENLAAKICVDYDITPAALVLVAHYVYAGKDCYFLYSFVHGDHDLFGGITLGGTASPSTRRR